MNKGSGFGPHMASTKGDGMKSAPLGKEYGPGSEKMAGACINGSLNYNSNETVKKVGK